MISKNRRVAKCEASSSEEPSAVIPHAGICLRGSWVTVYYTLISLPSQTAWAQALSGVCTKPMRFLLKACRNDGEWLRVMGNQELI